MLHIVYGPDSFSSREFIRDLVTSLMVDDPAGEGLARIDGRTTTPADVLNACGQVSLFGTRPVVLVEGLLSRFESKKQSGRSRGRKRKGQATSEWENFPAKVQPVVSASELILVDGELGKGNFMLAALAPLGQVHVFSRPGGEDLLRWIARRAKSGDAGIDMAAAQQLAALSQGDLWYLASEVDKLAAYCAGRTITQQAIAELTMAASTSSIFKLVDAIVESRARDAQRLLEDMWESGSSAGYVLTMVERQLRIVAQALEATGPHGRVTLQGGEFAALPEFAQRRAVGQARRLPSALVRAALDRVTAADKAVKTGTLDERVALDLLINDLASAARRK